MYIGVNMAAYQSLTSTGEAWVDDVEFIRWPGLISGAQVEAGSGRCVEDPIKSASLSSPYSYILLTHHSPTAPHGLRSSFRTRSPAQDPPRHPRVTPSATTLLHPPP